MRSLLCELAHILTLDACRTVADGSGSENAHPTAYPLRTKPIVRASNRIEVQKPLWWSEGGWKETSAFCRKELRLFWPAVVFWPFRESILSLLPCGLLLGLR